jgi:hypothetical protein
MKRYYTVLAFFVLIISAACLREWQTESMITPANSKVFLDEMRRSSKKANLDPDKRVGVSSALKVGDTFSPKTAAILKTVGNYYTFKSDDMSEHQKIMIDDFLKESVKLDDKLIRVTDERESDLLVVAYIRSYTWHRYLHFDIFDRHSNAQVGNIKYELSKMTTGVEQKVSQ